MELKFKSFQGAKEDWKKIKKKSVFSLRGYRYQLAFTLRVGIIIYVPDISRLTTKSGPVIDNLAIYLTG